MIPAGTQRVEANLYICVYYCVHNNTLKHTIFSNYVLDPDWPAFSKKVVKKLQLLVGKKNKEKSVFNMTSVEA